MPAFSRSPMSGEIGGKTAPHALNAGRLRTAERRPFSSPEYKSTADPLSRTMILFSTASTNRVVTWQMATGFGRRHRIRAWQCRRMAASSVRAAQATTKRVGVLMPESEGTVYSNAFVAIFETTLKELGWMPASIFKSTIDGPGGTALLDPRSSPFPQHTPWIAVQIFSKSAPRMARTRVPDGR